MRILRRFSLLGQRPQLIKNKQWLRNRQKQQLSILQMLKNNVDSSLLNCKIEDLLKLKSDKVFNTFTTRCLKPQILALNALADVNIQLALEKRGQEKIPFSVKDHLKVQGMITTCGFSDNTTPSTDSSDVVVLLQKEGCVPFAHTNVPQGLLGIQSTNPVYGTSYNPHNPSFLSGGSSGGEGALVAAKATAFGLGSDSGGSSRIPAAFCGIYGYKPTGSKRLSLKGRLGPNGQQGLKVGDLDSSMGFLTRGMDDLVWLCSKTLGKTIEGPQLYGGEWNQARYQAARRKKLRVGYMYNNPQMKIAPGIINTIEETLEQLRNKKHEVIEFKYDKLQVFRNYFFKFLHISGFINTLCNRLDGNLVSPQTLPFYDLVLFGKRGVKNKLKHMLHSPFKELFTYYLTDPTLSQFFTIHKELVEHKKSFLKEWKDKEIDVLVTPVMPFTALYPGTTELLVYQLTYCCFQNVLQLPAGVIPTRLVLPSETKYEPNTPFEHAAAASIKNSAGMPLAIQVTGQHLKDEECLGAMWQISKINGKYLQPPI